MKLSTEEIWNAFHQPLRAFIQNRVSDPEDADDLLQEVFVKLHTRLDTLQDEDRLVPWIYQVARHTIIDYYRARRPALPLPERLLVESDEASDDPTTQLARGLRAMIACLPKKYQQALVLTELEGQSQKVLADRLGLSLSGAKSRVQRGRTLLREAFLDCCHFEFDRRGKVVDYVPRPDCCERCRV